MNTRLFISHLTTALLALALGYTAASFRDEARKPAQPEDPVAALTAAVETEDVQARTQALLDFFTTADPAWAERLRAEFNHPDSKLILDETSEMLFAAWWARSNPEAAFKNRVDPAWANRHPWLREVMRQWVAVDPSGAAAAVESLPPNPDRGKVEAMRVIVDHWWDNPTTQDASPVLALVRGLEIKPRAMALSQLIEASIKKRGIDATEQFIESIPKVDDLVIDIRQELLGRYVQALVDHDVNRAVQWAEKKGEGREGYGIVRHLAFFWGVKDGPAAMNWAMSLPDTPERFDIIDRVWVSFRQAKPEEASSWLLAREPNGVLEGVYHRFLTGTAAYDPKQAIEVADRTKDPEIRVRLLQAVGAKWMEVDPKAALSWLDTVELEPEVEAQIKQGPSSNEAQKAILRPSSG